MRSILSLSALIASIALVACAAIPDPGADNPDSTEEELSVAGTSPAGPLDSDGNGAITLEEFLAGARDRMQHQDRNGDGVLSREELRAPGPPHGGRIPPDLDADQSGDVSVDEAEAMARAHFAELDRDGNGWIPAADLPPPPPGAPAMELDADKDGRISLDEFLAGHRAHFQMLDENGDGVLSADELGPPPGGRGAPDGRHALKGKMDRRGPPPQGGGHRGPPTFEELDTDGNGSITLAEMEAAARRHFTELDKDSNGRLEAGELPGHGGPAAQRRGGGGL